MRWSSRRAEIRQNWRGELALPPKAHKLVPERNGASFLPISLLPQPLPGKQREDLGWSKTQAWVWERHWDSQLLLDGERETPGASLGSAFLEENGAEPGADAWWRLDPQ